MVVVVVVVLYGGGGGGGGCMVVVTPFVHTFCKIAVSQVLLTLLVLHTLCTVPCACPGRPLSKWIATGFVLVVLSSISVASALVTWANTCT